MATMDDSCMETVMVDGKPKRRKKKGGCKQTFGRRSIPEGVKKVAKAAAVIGGGALAYAKNAFGVKDKVKELMGQKKGGAVKKYNDGGSTKTRTGRGGNTITKTRNSKVFNEKPELSYSMKDRSVSDKEGNLLKSRSKTTFVGAPDGAKKTNVTKWNLKKDPESNAKSRKAIISVKSKKK